MSDKQLKAHLFICTNCRSEKACCAARGSERLRQAVKVAVKMRPEWRGKVRINTSGCLDQCENGVAAVLYPKGEWFLHLTPEDAPKLLEAIERALTEER